MDFKILIAFAILLGMFGSWALSTVIYSELEKKYKNSVKYKLESMAEIEEPKSKSILFHLFYTNAYIAIPILTLTMAGTVYFFHKSYEYIESLFGNFDNIDWQQYQNPLIWIYIVMLLASCISSITIYFEVLNERILTARLYNSQFIYNAKKYKS